MKNQFMEEALKEAKLAASMGEVPVGALLVRDGEIIARSHNLTMEKSNMLRHAEILALEEGLARLGTRRLSDCDLYVSLEPCPMCAGAILLTAPRRLYFGAYDGEMGACGGKHDVLSGSGIEVYGGIMEDACKALLRDFFVKIRENK